jgi:hypothetical protein
MIIISSQHYRDDKITESKKLELTDCSELVLTVYAVGFDDLYILHDGHHAREAALELGLSVTYECIDHPAGLIGEDLLEHSWKDGDWYYIKTGDFVWR